MACFGLKMVFGNFQQVASARLVQCGVHYVHVWMLFNLGIYLFSNISALKWRELFEKMLLRYGLNLEWSSSEWAENILAVAKSPIFSQPYTAVRQTASPVGCKTLLTLCLCPCGRATSLFSKNGWIVERRTKNHSICSQQYRIYCSSHNVPE